MTIETSGHRLEVHVLNAGVGKGESIILRLPNGKWGVVDCYARSPSDPRTNPTIQFLQHRSRNVRELEFLCLTHPHDDHFRGMSQILELLPVRYFWRWAGMSNEELKWLVKVVKKRAEGTSDKRFEDRSETENATELQTIFHLVSKRQRENRRPLKQKLALSTVQLYPVQYDPDAHFRVMALAPSANQVERYKETLKHCFTKDGRIKQKFEHSHHNMVSVALLIQFGETRVVLGGDVEKAGWTDVIEEFGKDQLKAHGVKVSHHGSTNGYTDHLWEYFSADGKPAAVITPYRRFELPRHAAVEHIRQYADPVLISHDPSVADLGLPLAEAARVPLEISVLVQTTFQATTVRESDEFGRCTLVFDDRGNMAEPFVKSPAGEIVS